MSNNEKIIIEALEKQIKDRICYPVAYVGPGAGANYDKLEAEVVVLMEVLYCARNHEQHSDNPDYGASHFRQAYYDFGRRLVKKLQGRDIPKEHYWPIYMSAKNIEELWRKYMNDFIQEMKLL